MGQELELRELSLHLPKRKRNTHKGDYGRVLVIGGSVGFTGAPVMAAQAALLAGAGLVYLGVPRSIYPIIAGKCLEVMPFPIDLKTSPDSNPLFMDAFSKCSACVLGPGFARGADQERFLAFLMKFYQGTLILDADALAALATNPEMMTHSAARLILTPHDGEFERLHPGTVNRKEASEAFAQRYNCIVVLKGADTYAAFPEKGVLHSDLGNPGMATGGSGDVLAGLIGGFAGQFSAEKSVALALYVHGKAGDLAALEKGEYSMKAGDLLTKIPEVTRAITGK